ncbi:Fibrinogen C-terminal domain-containing protein [Trichostrongylus colubriformis]|uniref:Fibrinogen C-terminal domain-containing protein n=1 Tax=Trichostrongylus colubriformis TaxID=6319 RepID=A0AAN8IIE1_TRICO
MRWSSQLLLLVSLSIAVVSSDVICPEGDVLNSHDHCVHMETKLMSWSDSEAFCSARGGHLTSIHNQIDNTAVRSLGENTGCTSYWMGGQCNSGNCTWTDDSKFDFNNWSPEQPDLSNPCISSTFSTGQWNTADCKQTQCFACETQVVMTDCTDWYKAGYQIDGIYKIVVDGTSYQVYCDMTTAGGGWVVFQRRINDNDSFWDHSWDEYRNGFGIAGSDSNFWLGNEILHQLTMKDPDVTLRVEMRGDRTPSAKNPDGYWWNHYFNFQVGPEAAYYTLKKLTIDWQNIQGNASTGW